jgi:hypothetical protein
LDLSINDLSKFNPDEFETCHDAFMHFLAGKYGVTGEPLHYVICDAMALDELESEEISSMYQMPLAGAAYEMDWMTIYCDLKAYLIDTPGFTWIEAFDATEDGHGAYLAWEAHYNGQGELCKHMSLAKTQLDYLYYKSKQSMSFKHYSSKLKHIFQVLDKDPDERG